MADKNHSHEVTRGSINLLISCLSQPGWTKKPVEMFAAGELLEELDNAFGKDAQPEEDQGQDQSQFEERVKAWALRVVTLQLTEKQREAAKTAMAYCVAQGQVAPTKHFCSIGRALGLE